MTTSDLPLLFLDVDGPLVPFGATAQQLPGGYPTYANRGGAPGTGGNPLIRRINPAFGPRLLGLPCTLVWATTWSSDANDCIGPWLGLPKLPVVEWPELNEEQAEEFVRDAVHWKTRTLVHWAAGRDFVWVDDGITDADRTWVAGHHRHHPGGALLHHVAPEVGLTDRDFEAITEWLAGR
ncbi:hypothetical protein ACIO3O_36395 [Streptomyces sp. NPDC087440]|uniref:hypothetical protein n=1 Tax=Streptomyces sp. NPDC087440 TaxID=3365790 RepID=UPI00380CA539